MPPASSQPHGATRLKFLNVSYVNIGERWQIVLDLLEETCDVAMIISGSRFAGIGPTSYPSRSARKCLGQQLAGPFIPYVQRRASQHTHTHQRTR